MGAYRGWSLKDRVDPLISGPVGQRDKENVQKCKGERYIVSGGRWRPQVAGGGKHSHTAGKGSKVDPGRTRRRRAPTLPPATRGCHPPPENEFAPADAMSSHPYLREMTAEVEKRYTGGFGNADFYNVATFCLNRGYLVRFL